MKKTGVGSVILSFFLKPLLVLLLISGVFGVVYLRSSVMKLEYSIGELEKKKVDYLKERKMLLAQKTSMLSFEKLEASFGNRQGFVLPDRVKVIHVDKQKRYLPRKTSLEKRQLAEP
jgi:hypothetical protein